MIYTALKNYDRALYFLEIVSKCICTLSFHCFLYFNDLFDRDFFDLSNALGKGDLRHLTCPLIPKSQYV